MAMENSAVSSDNVTREFSPISKEESTYLDAAKEQQGGDDAAQDREKEETLHAGEPKNVADPEGVFVDAESLTQGGVDSRKVPEDEEDGDAVEDENGSIESYDSALERIAVASTGDPSSPEGPSSPVFQPHAETPQQIALRQLNLWTTGIFSLDSKVLENVSPTELRTHVTQAAQSQGLPADSEDVEHVFSALLPLVEEKESKGVQGEAEIELKDANDVPAGDENKDSDGHVDESRQDVSSSDTKSEADDVRENVEVNTKEIPSTHAESNGEVAVDLVDIQPVETSQSKDTEDIDSKTEDLVTLPESASEDFSKGDMKKEGVKGSADDGILETQGNSLEPEPEVIEWNDSNESDLDDLCNYNAEDPPAEDKEPKETLGLDSMDVTASQQEREIIDDSLTPTIEGKVEGADIPPRETLDDSQSSTIEGKVEGSDISPHDAIVDSAEEPKEESIGGDGSLHAGNEEEDPRVLNLDAQAAFEPDDDKPAGTKETSGDGATDSTEDVDDKQSSGNDAGADLKVDDRPSLDVLAERDVKPTLEELNADDEKAEVPKPGSEESEEADVVKGSEVEVSGDTAISASEVNEGPQAGEEPPAALAPHVVDNETLEGEFAQETKDPLKEEELPGFENMADASKEEEESATAPALAADVTSADEESKQLPNEVRKGEDFEKEEIPVDSKAATLSSNDSSSSLGGAGPSLPARPAGLGRSVPSLEHAPRAVQRTGAAPASIRPASVSNEENQSSTDVSEGNEESREKLQMIRVKFLRLAQRLGQSAHNVVVAQVLYRLGLAEQLRGGRGSSRSGAFSFERASVLAEEQEATGADDLDFGCTIMVLGKSGVGKSATINCLFDEIKSGTNAYSPATNKVQEIVGYVHGIKLRVIDTPGLLTSFADQRRNERIMSSVKRFIKKSPPDIVLYFDRLDMQSRDYGDLPLLRTITDTFGSAVWFNAIVVLTHASSAPPDGANGVPVSYEMFVAQRSHVVQQTIRQAAGDMRLMNPVSLVENHAACRRNRAGERVLPNGQVWKPQLLLLCCASKILAEANSLLKLQDNTPTKPFGVRSRVPPLPFLLSSLLQSRAQLKLPDEQVGSDDDESEDESDGESESDGEEEFDDLPPFRRLTRDELKLLDKEQRRTYAEELEYREKLFMKKQLKDEKARKKEMKRRFAALPKEAVMYAEENFEDENASASVPVPMPDMALPPSFDSDNPTYRYRYLDAANQWLVRPVLETHGWDHDSGYDGLNVEKMFVVSKKIPVSVSGQVTKDKKEANLQMECAASFKNGEGKVTQAGLDIQTIGKDLAYTVRSETRFDNFKRNKTTCGLAVTLLGDTVAAGMKIEDRLLIGKRVKLVFNGGALTGRGDVAYGGSLEASIRDKDYPIGQFLATFGLSVMDWHGDLAIGGNLQVQCKVGKAMTIVRGNLNNRRAGQISIRVSSSEYLQMALIGLIPVLRTFINNKILSSN